MSKESTFWDHLEVLRWMIFRSLIAIMAVAVIVFAFKDFIFDGLIFAPLSDDFVTYRWLNGFIQPIGDSIEIININLATQFITHMRVAAMTGLIFAIPYILVEIWLFVKPALYTNERSAVVKGAVAFVVLFIIGITISYLFIFPFTLSFLGNYSISDAISNQISLDSYISTFLILIFTMGLIFELPIAAYLLAKIGILKYEFMKKYRKYAIVIILILSAIITPSGDAFTMLLVAMPIWLLWELSGFVVKHTNKVHNAEI